MTSQFSLLLLPLNQANKIAFISSPRLGDTLLGMVTVNNLVRNGYAVDVYGDYIYALRAWFPWANIFPSIISISNSNTQTAQDSTAVVHAQKILAQYPVVLFMYDDEIATQLISQHPCLRVLARSPLYKAHMTMVDIQATLCDKDLGLKNVVRENNIQPLTDLIAHRYKQRVVIHPTSFLPRKNWPKRKFIKLAQKLMQQNYEVYFIVSPEERTAWLDVVSDYGIKLPKFNLLSDVAAFVYEAAFFIGNDSGIGHLASNLGVPTVSIILRPSVARQWQPAWAVGEVVISPAWLNPRPLKEKLWKYFITVNMVWKKFMKLQQRLK